MDRGPWDRGSVDRGSGLASGGTLFFPSLPWDDEWDGDGDWTGSTGSFLEQAACGSWPWWALYPCVAAPHSVTTHLPDKPESNFFFLLFFFLFARLLPAISSAGPC